MSGSCCEKEASLLGCSQSSSTHSAKEGKERCNDFSVETEDVSSSADLVLMLFTRYETTVLTYGKDGEYDSTTNKEPKAGQEAKYEFMVCSWFLIR